MNLTLISFGPEDRGGKIRWLLEELNLPYAIKTINGRAREHRTPEYLKIHPFGKVPTLMVDDVPIIESGAIALYLSDRHTDQHRLAPKIDSPERMEFLKWFFLSTVTLDPLLVEADGNEDLTVEEKAQKLNEIYHKFSPTAYLLEQILKDSEFLIRNQFSTVDIMLAQPLEWADKGGLLEKHPVLQAYLNRLKKRQACIKSAIFKGP